MIHFLKKMTSFDYLMLSLLGYDLIFTLGPLLMPKLVYNVIQLICVVLFFYTYIKEKKSIKFLDPDIRFILMFFIVWNFLVVIYSLLTVGNVRLLMLYIVQPNSFLIYLTPLLMLIKFDANKIKKLSKWLFVNIGLGLFFYILLRNRIAVTDLSDINIAGNLSLYTYLNIAQYPSSCFMAAAFVFILGNYTSKWKSCFLWMAFGVAVVAALLMGRRSSALIPVAVCLAKIFFNFYNKPKTVILIIILMLGIYMGYDYIEKNFFSTFIILQERALDNTRYWVEHDYYRDMHGWDYIIGRGSEGLVFSSELGRRPIIETGYLNMILHGGIIYLFLYLYLLVLSAVRGFCSNNNLLKAMSMFIIIMIACLYPGGHLHFSLGTTALWACVACCSNSKYRQCNISIKL